MKKRVLKLAIVLLGSGCVSAIAAGQPDLSDALTVCAKADRRIPVPVWEPEVDAAGNASSDPPQQDSQIVYIAIDHAPNAAGCDDTQMFTFSRPESSEDPTLGGLAVNISGNARALGGNCRLRGYYRNQEVTGMHQGWVETYFGAVEQGVVLPGKYCLVEPVK